MTAEPEFSLIVGYGSDMGNAEDAAMTFAEAVEEALGVSATAIELNQVEPGDLRSATHLIVACSTWGEGEFPDNGSLFWEAISADGATIQSALGLLTLATFTNGPPSVDDTTDVNAAAFEVIELTSLVIAST